jgi:hypothetical protein
MKTRFFSRVTLRKMKEVYAPNEDIKIIWVDDEKDIDETQKNICWVYLRKDVFDIGDDEDVSG